MISLSPYINNETSGDKKEESKQCFLCGNLYMWVDTHERYTHIVCIKEYMHTQEQNIKKCVKTANTLGIAN